jgi:large subunit ribosomal protein L22
MTMSYSAKLRFARISPRKARLVADMISGQNVDTAMTALEFSKLRAAWYLKGLLKSAIANAEEKDASVPNLFIAESRVDEGPVLKRFQPKDRGRAHPIHKKTSHFIITLEERG